MISILENQDLFECDMEMYLNNRSFNIAKLEELPFSGTRTLVAIPLLPPSTPPPSLYQNVTSPCKVH